MDDAEATDPLLALQRDLTDGDDLAGAMDMIASSLQRRIADLRTALQAAAASEAGEARLPGLVERLRASVRRYETMFDRHCAELRDSIVDFQAILDDISEEIDRSRLD